MGTHCMIGIKTGDVVMATYCHWDGYPSVVGRMLLQYYNDRPRTRLLVNGGSMSQLGPTFLTTYYRHQMDKDQPLPNGEMRFVPAERFSSAKELMEMKPYCEYFYVLDDEEY